MSCILIKNKLIHPTQWIAHSIEAKRNGTYLENKVFCPLFLLSEQPRAMREDRCLPYTATFLKAARSAMSLLSCLTRVLWSCARFWLCFRSCSRHLRYRSSWWCCPLISIFAFSLHATHCLVMRIFLVKGNTHVMILPSDLAQTVGSSNRQVGQELC